MSRRDVMLSKMVGWRIERGLMRSITSCGMTLALAAGAVLLTHSLSAAQAQGAAVTAIVGGTVIDGNGGPPIVDAVVLINGSRISAIGPRAVVPIPADARRIDATGRWIVPGFIDTNVHLSLYGGQNDRYETLARYQLRQEEIVLEAAQIDLSYGITTVRDSYGALVPLTRVRDQIARGDKVGTRIRAAGNILGWGGPYSFTFSRVMGQLTLFQEQMNDFIAQGGGEELLAMTPDELRTAIDAYLDKGPDFLKYGGTSHFSDPTLIGFSPEAQKVIVDEGHRRNRFVETHSTSIEGLRMSIAAGIAAEIQGEALIEEPGGQQPAEEIRGGHAEKGPAIVPDPGARNGCAGRLQDQIPLRHHQSGGNRKRYRVETLIQPAMRAVQQNPGHHPGKVAHAEPQRANHQRSGADIRKIAGHLEMVAAEGKARCYAEVLHRIGDADADKKEHRRMSPAIGVAGMRQSGGDPDGREPLRERRRAPGKAHDKRVVGNGGEP